MPQPELLKLSRTRNTLIVVLQGLVVLAVVHGAIRIAAGLGALLVYENEILIWEGIQLLLAFTATVIFGIWVFDAKTLLLRCQTLSPRFTPTSAMVLVVTPLVNLVGWWFVPDEIAVLSRRDGSKFVRWYSVASASSEVTAWYLVTGIAVVLWLLLPFLFLPHSRAFAFAANWGMAFAQLLTFSVPWLTNRMLRRVEADIAKQTAVQASPTDVPTVESSFPEVTPRG